MAFLTLFNVAGISGLAQRSVHIIKHSINVRTVKVQSKDLITMRALRCLRCYHWPATITRDDASAFFVNVTRRHARKLDAFMHDVLG